VQSAIVEEMNKPKGQVATVSLASLKRRVGVTPPVLMAVASSGGNVVNQHFGHATEFLVYEASEAGVRFIGTRRTDQYCVGSDHCDEGDDKLARSITALEGCRAVLCARIGITPWEALEAAGIKPDSDHAMEPIEEAVAALYAAMAEAGELTTAPTAGASVA
jgi:nitrogen fixation protein NifB